MTLRMADGPVANLPPGLDAYAGYVNVSGIGVTFPQVEAKFPNAHHLSITTDGHPAMCADVESGAMSDWTGYTVGYCSVSMVNTLVARFGRPRKLWTAHYDGSIGAHICSPRCWPGLVTTADGTQWIDHNGQWDESLLADNFFDFLPAPPTPPIPPTPEVPNMDDGGVAVIEHVNAPGQTQRHVFAVVNGELVHAYQSVEGPDFTWHSEKIPLPA